MGSGVRWVGMVEGRGGGRTRSWAEGEEGWSMQRRAIPSAIFVVVVVDAKLDVWDTELEAVQRRCGIAELELQPITSVS